MSGSFPHRCLDIANPPVGESEAAIGPLSLPIRKAHSVESGHQLAATPVSSGRKEQQSNGDESSS